MINREASILEIARPYNCEEWHVLMPQSLDHHPFSKTKSFFFLNRHKSFWICLLIFFLYDVFVLKKNINMI
jgi:hypothetical protein